MYCTRVRFNRLPFSGTFFLSVHKSHKSAVEILHNGYNRYLCAVCVGCLHGYSAKVGLFLLLL